MVIEGHKFIKASLYFCTYPGQLKWLSLTVHSQVKHYFISQTQFIIMMYTQNKLLIYTSY